MDEEGQKYKVAYCSDRYTENRDKHHLNMQGNYFANRVVNLWNSLMDNGVAAPSVYIFKRRLDKHRAALPSMYNPECLA